MIDAKRIRHATFVTGDIEAQIDFQRGKHLPIGGPQGFRANRSRQILTHKDAVGRVQRHQGVDIVPAQRNGVALHDRQELGRVAGWLAFGAADGCKGGGSKQDATRCKDGDGHGADPFGRRHAR